MRLMVIRSLSMAFDFSHREAEEWTSALGWCAFYAGVALAMMEAEEAS